MKTPLPLERAARRQAAYSYVAQQLLRWPAHVAFRRTDRNTCMQALRALVFPGDGDEDLYRGTYIWSAWSEIACLMGMSLFDDGDIPLEQLIRALGYEEPLPPRVRAWYDAQDVWPPVKRRGSKHLLCRWRHAPLANPKDMRKISPVLRYPGREVPL